MENNPYYFNEKANELMEKKEYEKALEFYTKAISLNSEEAIFFHNTGVCLISSGEYLRAISLFEKALELKISLEETKYYLILCLYESRKYEEIFNYEVPEENVNLKIESYILLVKSAVKIKNHKLSKLYLNKLNLMGFNSQELELISKMI